MREVGTESVSRIYGIYGGNVRWTPSRFPFKITCTSCFTNHVSRFTENSMFTKLTHLLLAVLVLLLSGCRPATAESAGGPGTASSPVKTLTVFAAASLTEAFGEIGQQFEAANPGVKVIYNFAGSAQLAQQLSQGAPADVFASADLQKMEVVAQAHRVSGDMPADLRTQPAGGDLSQRKPGQTPNLARPGQTRPAPGSGCQGGAGGKICPGFPGQGQSGSCLWENHIKRTFLKNVVSYEENVKAVFSKVALGEADAGIVYTSDISKGQPGQSGQPGHPGCS